MNRHPGTAWCVTEDIPAKKSCGASGHDVGPLDSQGKRTAYLLAPTRPDVGVTDIAEALAEGRKAEES
jgi:hypothetical protein